VVVLMWGKECGDRYSNAVRAEQWVIAEAPFNADG
jgi:hypothetical protein